MKYIEFIRAKSFGIATVVVVVDPPLLRVAVEGSDNPRS